MDILGIIAKKRDGGELSSEEINFAVLGYAKGAIPDYQMSSFLMAVYVRGISLREILELTEAMIASGIKADLSGVPGIKVDKHSTGGVGDGTSLVVAPLAAACGLVVPMMAGRSLGHTGGTLDKLEAIPGFRTGLSFKEYQSQLGKIGVCITGQTAEMVPADKKLYALRDVTSTVDSPGLIAASIMSKKLAEGCGALLLDVKTGAGAFMKALEPARELASIMVSIGKSHGTKVQALITSMAQPLGRAVGNSLEVAQAVDVLKGGGPEDFVSLVMELTARMLVLGGISADTDSAKTILQQNIRNGKALDKFRSIVQAQGGNPGVVDMPWDVLPGASRVEAIPSPSSGYIVSADALKIGRASTIIGAGRMKKDDIIDPGAGVAVLKKTGDKVEKGEPLCSMHYNNTSRADEARQELIAAYAISHEKKETQKLIYEQID